MAMAAGEFWGKVDAGEPSAGVGGDIGPHRREFAHQRDCFFGNTQLPIDRGLGQERQLEVRHPNLLGRTSS
jgi:hypothetical protein